MKNKTPCGTKCNYCLKSDKVFKIDKDLYYCQNCRRFFEGENGRKR